MRKRYIGNVSAVDLFCGIGGLTRGLKNAGIHVVAGIDIDDKCKYIYEVNNYTRFIQADIGKLTSSEVNRLYPEGHIKVLVGCAPCQPFSTYTQRYKNRAKDERWKLLYSFSRIVRSVEPSIISMENVPLLAKSEPFKELIRTLDRMHYHYSYSNVRCENYGIPQRRLRLVLLASKFGEINLIPPTHSKNNYVTVRDAIGHLEKLDAGECSQTDPLHRARSVSSTNRQRLLSSRPGGTWKDWDPSLVAPCHRKAGGSTYSSVYGRMSWDKPSPTITTQFYNYGSGRFGHPEQTRALTYREGAILQSFPDNYVFVDSKHPLNVREIGTYIGNAVPVRLGEVIGKTITQHLRGVNIRQQYRNQDQANK